MRMMNCRSMLARFKLTEEEGQALVEFALVLIFILIPVTFAFIEASVMLYKYYNGVKRLLFKWLNRRSQRRSYNYKGFVELCKHFKVLRPKIVEKPGFAFAR